VDSSRLNPLSSAPAVADYLGNSLPNVYRLLRNKKLKGVKVGGQWRISAEALRQFLEDSINLAFVSNIQK
jgi:excisionase family DNA binding protein